MQFIKFRSGLVITVLLLSLVGCDRTQADPQIAKHAAGVKAFAYVRELNQVGSGSQKNRDIPADSIIQIDARRHKNWHFRVMEDNIDTFSGKATFIIGAREETKLIPAERASMQRITRTYRSIWKLKGDEWHLVEEEMISDAGSHE